MSKRVNVQMRPYPSGQWRTEFKDMDEREAEDLVYFKNRMSPYDWRVEPLPVGGDDAAL